MGSAHRAELRTFGFHTEVRSNVTICAARVRLPPAAPPPVAAGITRRQQRIPTPPPVLIDWRRGGFQGMVDQLIFLSVVIGVSLWIVICMVPWLWVGPRRLFKSFRLKQEIKNDRWKSIN